MGRFLAKAGKQQPAPPQGDLQGPCHKGLLKGPGVRTKDKGLCPKALKKGLLLKGPCKAHHSKGIAMGIDLKALQQALC